jgi:uncharacterized ion transporter superfamily protein YfcC
MKTRAFPNTYVILFGLILLCAAVTWLLPGGQYVTGQDGVLVFQEAAAAPQTWQVFSALYHGFVKQAGIIVFILIVGGAFWILNATGAADFGIRRFISKTGRYDKAVLALIALLFSAGGAIFGMSEETIPFVGLVVPMTISMGYNAIVGLMVVYVASNIGFSSAFLNPFTVGIAQEMSDLPMFSGMGYRIFCWALLTGLFIVFTLIYASRVKKAAPQAEASEPLPEDTEGSHTRHWIVLGILGATIVALIVGVTCFHWYIAEISALFLAMGILCGIAGGFKANRIAGEFIAGAKDIFGAAMVVGLASGIIIILQDGHVLDTILHSLQTSLDGSSKTASLSMMYGVQTLINLLIPSATAKAAITIPVMAPLCDLIGFGRQSMVLAFQFGDGFTNMITPTSGVLMAALAMARVDYKDWARSVWKPVLVLIALGFLLLLPTIFIPLKGF